MRDPKRIYPNWQKIAALHAQFPDWRMGQFLENVLDEITQLEGIYRSYGDFFYFEDDKFIELFERAVKSLKGEKINEDSGK